MLPSLQICHDFIFMMRYVRRVTKDLLWLTVLRPQSGTITLGSWRGDTSLWKLVKGNTDSLNSKQTKRKRGTRILQSTSRMCHPWQKESPKVSSPPQSYHLSTKHLMCGLFRDIYPDNPEISMQVEIQACFFFFFNCCYLLSYGSLCQQPQLCCYLLQLGHKSRNLRKFCSLRHQLLQS